MAFLRSLRSISSALARQTQPGMVAGLASADALAPLAPFAAAQLRFMSGSKLFVGGLAWETDDSTLRDAFSSFGEVFEAKVIFDRVTGRSRGFGFVSFSSEEDAQSALAAMDGKFLGGRTIRVDFAQQREPAQRRPRYDQRGGYGQGSQGGFAQSGYSQEEQSPPAGSTYEEPSSSEGTGQPTYGGAVGNV